MHSCQETKPLVGKSQPRESWKSLCCFCVKFSFILTWIPRRTPGATEKFITQCSIFSAKKINRNLFSFPETPQVQHIIHLTLPLPSPSLPPNYHDMSFVEVGQFVDWWVDSHVSSVNPDILALTLVSMSRGETAVRDQISEQTGERGTLF